MRIYELLKVLFARPSQRPPGADLSLGSTAPLLPSAADLIAKREAYLAIHPTSIAKEATLFWEKYHPDFNAFLYRPATADFIRREVLPLRGPAEQYNGFLDNSHWASKHYLNFPGPFYTGESDTCGTGDGEAPANVLYDAFGCEYVFRQPQNFVEFLGVLDAAAVEVLDSYSCDGNDYWTVALCREWWRGKPEYARRLASTAFQKVNGTRTQLYLDYLNGPAETDLRRYCYFLKNGAYPTAEHTALPVLEAPRPR